MPDINSIPAPPRQTPLPAPPSQPQRRQSTAPSQTAVSPNILPSNQQSYSQSSCAASLPSPPLSTATATATTTATMPPPPVPTHSHDTDAALGPGPTRHPHPLTAAEMHSQMEQEQELLVNRLTRDLSLLRAAQNSSVVSNTSSTSASNSIDQPHTSFADTHLLSGPGLVPSTSADRRHHRASSSASTRSFSQAATTGSTPAPVPIGQSSTAASALEAARHPRGGVSMSRQNSTTSHRSTSTSRNRSPQPYPYHLPGSYAPSHPFPLMDHSSGTGYFPRGSNPQSTAATPGSEMSPGLMPVTPRYEETAQYRQELEIAKRENDALKHKIKELEKRLRERRESDASAGGARLRSESVSTTASTTLSVAGAGGIGGGGVGIAGGRGEQPRGSNMERAFSSLSVTGSVGVGVPEEEVKFGESAANAGLGTRREAK